MTRKIFINILIIVLSVQGTSYTGEKKSAQDIVEISNSAYRLTVTRRGNQLGVRLYDLAADVAWSDAPYCYRAVRSMDLVTQEYQSLESLSINQRDNNIVIDDD